MDPPPFDRPQYFLRHFEHLDRALYRPQLAGIGISGTIGAGMFISCGAIIGISGSVGGPLSYMVAGFIVGSVMYTISEMVACRPLTGALIDFPHTFVDPALGFAVCTIYLLANACSMATLTEQTTELVANFSDPPQPLSGGAKAGINVFLICLTTVSHCFGVRFYGYLERVIMWFKLCLIVLVCILMLVVNVGGGGPRTGSFHGNYTKHGFPLGFKPAGFIETSLNTTLQISGTDSAHFGIPGSGGIFVAFLNSVTIAIFACMGGDQVIMTAGEAADPWNDLPAVTSFVYLIPLSLYPIATFTAGANVNYGAPDLSHPWGRTNTSLSPFIIAVRTTSLHGLYYALNFFFMICAYTAANTALYVATRAAFILAQNYMPTWVANSVGRTNNGNTPLTAIIFCSILGFLSLVGLSKDEYSQPRLTLSEFFTGSIACVYISECLSFLKFKAGLDELEKCRIFSRNDPRYIRYLFKSRWQPLVAYVGIVGCGIVILFSGFPALFILGARSGLSDDSNLKKPEALVGDVIGAYFGPFLFLFLYFVYKYGYPRTEAVHIRDLTLSTYLFPADMSEIELDNQNVANATKNQGPTEQQPRLDVSVAEAQNTLISNRLEARRKREWRGVLRELWSFVITDKAEEGQNNDTANI